MTRELTIGLVQNAVSPDIVANLEKTDACIGDAVANGAQIVCLQELFATPYIAIEEDETLLDTAEPIPGKVSTFLETMATKYSVALVGGSLYELDEDGQRYNTSLVLDSDGSIVAKYRKMHVPQDPYYYEKFYFSPGNLGYVQASVAGTIVAPLICYDQWYPEPARINVLKGKVEIIFYPTAIGWFDEMWAAEPFSAQRWEDAMRAHASMNGVFVAAVNRVGVERSLTFWGGSFIADPFGQVVARASATEDEVLVATIDLDRVQESQDGWFFLQNRRPDSYNDLVT
jgi:N-carbamoylputrescine amidase